MMKAPGLAMLFTVALAMSALPYPSMADGKYYRWTDSTGAMQISDRPPPLGTEYEVGHMAGGDNFVSAPEAQNAPRPSNERSEPMMAVGSNPGAAPEYVKDPALCQSARENLQALENYVRIMVQDSDGTQRILSPEEKQTEMAKAQQIIDLNCD